MRIHEFAIGREFTSEAVPGRFRCTDVGTRVVVAIRVDAVAVGGGTLGPDGRFTPREVRTMTGAEAEVRGDFRGPPYGVAERVFDEHDLPHCRPA